MHNPHLQIPWKFLEITLWLGIISFVWSKGALSSFPHPIGMETVGTTDVTAINWAPWFSRWIFHMDASKGLRRLVELLQPYAVLRSHLFLEWNWGQLFIWFSKGPIIPRSLETFGVPLRGWKWCSPQQAAFYFLFIPSGENGDGRGKQRDGASKPSLKVYAW